MSQSKDFVLKSSEAFAERRKNVFDQLSTLENNLKTSPLKQMESMDIDETKSPPVRTKQYRGKESIFKRPRDPITKDFIRKMPDFKKNPHKWVKYSLDDVKDEDISDRGNTKAALSFLNELRSRRKNETETNDEDDNEPKKIIFRKRTVPDSKNETDSDKASFRSSKVVMPEYVVGQKVKKEKKNRELKKEKEPKRQELKLNHLYEEDE